MHSRRRRGRSDHSQWWGRVFEPRKRHQPGIRDRGSRLLGAGGKLL